MKHNTFLIYKDEFADFILRADIKLRNHNSGIRFRSQRKDDWVVTGCQAGASEVSEEKSAGGNFYAGAGVIAIQMHMGQPMEVQFRNIKLKVLP